MQRNTDTDTGRRISTINPQLPQESFGILSNVFGEDASRILQTLSALVPQILPKKFRPKARNRRLMVAALQVAGASNQEIADLLSVHLKSVSRISSHEETVQARRLFQSILWNKVLGRLRTRLDEMASELAYIALDRDGALPGDRIKAIRTALEYTKPEEGEAITDDTAELKELATLVRERPVTVNIGIMSSMAPGASVDDKSKLGIVVDGETKVLESAEE